jgi:SAM-dependent methyltransferase
MEERVDTRGVVSRRLYDRLYARGAPWESGPRSELVGLVESGRLTPTTYGPRVLDVGCGSGANSLFVAARGFEVTGVDFSRVALTKAREATPEGASVRFVDADLTGPTLGEAEGEYDVLVDYGTLDDFGRRARPAVVRTLLRVSHPGSALLLWCFYLEIPWWRRAGARFPGGLRPDEVRDLGDGAFRGDRLPEPAEGSGYACFLLTREAV